MFLSFILLLLHEIILIFLSLVVKMQENRLVFILPIELTHKLKKICEFFEYSISVSVWAVNFHKKHNKCTEILSGKKFFQ